MPNWCSIHLEIKCKDNEVANNIRQLLELMDYLTEDKGNPLYLGTNERYVFDATIYQKENTIVLQGNTRWYLAPEDFKTWIIFLISYGDDFEEATADYEELGCGVYGKYTYNSQSRRFYDKYIPAAYFPPYREIYDNVYLEILDAFLEENGAEKLFEELNDTFLQEKRNKRNETTFEKRKEEIIELASRAYYNN